MPAESRNRMVSFRLTVEEYDRFRELCGSRGIRTVSELARTAINGMLAEPGPVPQEALETRVNDLESRVHALSLEMRKLLRTSPRPPQELAPLAIDPKPDRGTAA
jgi:hypothetical protein